MRFYHEVLGWTFQRLRDAGGHDYVQALVSDEPVAGLRPHNHSVRDWTLYLSAWDLAATTERARRLGGVVLEPRPHALPGVGAPVLIDDPSGAGVGLLELAGGQAFTAGVPGSLVWVEFVTRHAALADRFFGRLFGYTQRQFGDGHQVDYVVYSIGDDSALGRVRMALDTPADTPPRWIAHFAVHPDVGFNESLRRAHSAGARLRFPPYTSSLGKVAVLSDPLGTRFALIDPSLAAEWEYGSAADDPYDD
ncbi:hydrolase [Amycolatopsis taiwanensis]|uniref:Hydrolase n=2 Tax=Amycolatopsis taiwanensis TaxID=342230 RepID=A0A9W6QZX3_9PSEU|nr:hydrolase [Amycolatopsis taiwanensis]